MSIIPTSECDEMDWQCLQVRPNNQHTKLEETVTQLMLITLREKESQFQRQNGNSLECLLFEKGLQLASNNLDRMQVYRAKWHLSPMHLWGKYVADPISNSLHWIDHQRKYVFDSAYKEQYDYAVKVCQKERYPYQIYSKGQIEEALTELAQLSEKMGPIIGNQLIANVGVFSVVGNLRSGGPSILHGLNLLSATLTSILANGPEAQKIKSDINSASNKLKSMVEANQEASYRKSLDLSYAPKLFLKTTPLTREQEILSAWGVEFLIDGEGFEFGFHFDRSF